MLADADEGEDRYRRKQQGERANEAQEYPPYVLIVVGFP